MVKITRPIMFIKMVRNMLRDSGFNLSLHESKDFVDALQVSSDPRIEAVLRKFNERFEQEENERRRIRIDTANRDFAYGDLTLPQYIEELRNAVR